MSDYSVSINFSSESNEPEMSPRPEKMERGMKFMAHLIRTSKECWCDKLACEQYSKVIILY